MNWFILFAVIFMWASAFIGIKVGLEDFSPWSLALLRYGIASIFISVIYIFLPKKKWPSWKEFGYLLVCGGAGIALYNLMLNYAEINVSPAISSFIIGMVPVSSLIMARFLFCESSISKYSQTCITLCILGLSVILLGDILRTDDFHASLLGFLALIFAVFGSTLYANLNRIMHAKGYHPLELTAWSIWLGTLMMLIFLPETVLDVQKSSLMSLINVTYLGIFPAALAFAGYSYAISRLPFEKVMVSLYCSPIMVVIMQWGLLDMKPDGLVLMGGVVSVVGAVLLILKRAHVQKNG